MRGSRGGNQNIADVKTKKVNYWCGKFNHKWELRYEEGSGREG